MPRALRFRGQLRRERVFARAGMTMLELVIACSILMILSAMALPTYRYTVIRAREGELRYDLRAMREGIDRYHQAANQHKFRTPVNSENFPADLDTLVQGVQIGADGRRLVFLRKVPVDPTTGQANWGLRCSSDDFDSKTWCGTNVFDVYSKSDATALDGTKYADW